MPTRPNGRKAPRRPEGRLSAPGEVGCRWALGRAILAVLALGWLACAAPVAAQGSPSDWDRFQLWTGCAPLEVSIEALDSEAVKIGLSEDAIRFAVESRLRGARVYRPDSDSMPFLGVSTGVVSEAFSLSVSLYKLVFDEASGPAQGHEDLGKDQLRHTQQRRLQLYPRIAFSPARRVHSRVPAG